MTASRPKKQKADPCPSGVPHHWVIGTERDVDGFFPAECRNCGGGRKFSGAADPDYSGSYANYSTTKVLFTTHGRRGVVSDPLDTGSGSYQDD